MIEVVTALTAKSAAVIETDGSGSISEGTLVGK
jgi:hypothetical protein